eukprot:TRINITY_DN6287_c0_g1_i1.p1 TRINITY_DN6287_c0_g1~~TRINITY_DN6287_c0_g1_i1.p1  ORF type:complete len:505 (+),score=161.84 TRINITY_DN6287_c0_g1_i1:97-1611(+)
MIRRPPRSTLSSSSAASDVYKRQQMEGSCTPANASKAFVADAAKHQQATGLVPHQPSMAMSRAVPADTKAGFEAALLQSNQTNFMSGWNADATAQVESWEEEFAASDAQEHHPGGEEERLMRRIQQMQGSMDLHNQQWECMSEIEKAELEEAGLKPDGSNFDECWKKATAGIPGMPQAPHMPQDTEAVLERYAQRLKEDGQEELAEMLTADPEAPEYKFCESQPSEATQDVSVVHAAIAELEAGALTSAIAQLERFVRGGAGGAEQLGLAWRKLGQAHAERDDDQQAIAALLQAVQIDASDTSTLLELGVSCTNEANRKQAYTFLLEWLGAQEGHPGAAPRDVNLESVMKAFVQASASMPASVGLCTALGVLCNLSQEFDKAIEWFKKGLRLQPESYSLWNKLGATQANSGLKKEALNAYNQALALKPGYVRAWNNVAISHARDNPTESARYFLKALSLYPGAELGWEYLAAVCAGIEDEALLEVLKDAHHRKDVTPFRDHFQF